jgi:hypothetical protein
LGSEVISGLALAGEPFPLVALAFVFGEAANFDLTADAGFDLVADIFFAFD